VLTDTNSELAILLAESKASSAFKDGIVGFLQSGATDRIQIRGYAPRVKVARLLKYLLASHPDLEIEAVELEAQSGCSDFVGTVRLETASGTRAFDFHWCCRWRAEEEGWTDYFGFPDQMRAAREFDWRCFRVWLEQ
jgi:hypothetical protein